MHIAIVVCHLLFSLHLQWPVVAIPQTSPNLVTYDYDVEKAKALLTEADYPNGFSCTLYVQTAAIASNKLAIFLS